MTDPTTDIKIAIAWCLAWGQKREPNLPLDVLKQMRQAIELGQTEPAQTTAIVKQVQQLVTFDFPKTVEALNQLATHHPLLWDSQIGLVYGGATKIKQYVFEAAKLPDIRGASGLLDRINLIDLPAFFGAKEPQCEKYTPDAKRQQIQDYCQKVGDWLRADNNFPYLADALIPELIIYSTGGNILAFCPAAFVDDLANAIEKRYTEETLTANSCAVGARFKPLEVRFGLLKTEIKETSWLDWYRQNYKNPLVETYFGCPENQQKIDESFQNRKNFNELTGKLAVQFNQRRNGNDLEGVERPTRRYPPVFETHPYLRRDAGDRRSAIYQVQDLPGTPWYSESLIRKRLVSELAKQGNSSDWYDKTGLEWRPGIVDSWVNKFREFLRPQVHRYYANVRAEEIDPRKVDEAQSVREIGNASKPQGFVAYIYADGNNMGGYIQKEIKNPENYKQFSRDIFKATEHSVYKAIAQHLPPHKLSGLSDSDNRDRNGTWIHPFEIITIGGDDVMLIVPADKALAIAQTIGEEFEKELLKLDDKRRYGNNKTYAPELVHRYAIKLPSGNNQCNLSMSIGVLIIAEDTPIYYAEKLTNQLLKLAKKKAKHLKEKFNYYGGTIDFFVMKSVTMISSNIEEFRNQGLTKLAGENQKLKLYAAPYTLHEIGGLLATAKALKGAEFPRSQLYQIRSFLEQGKRTAILNYLYFRTRLKQGQKELKETFDEAWCKAKTNNGNLAPWIYVQPKDEQAAKEKSGKVSLSKPQKDSKTSPREPQESTYETIWRELVDLYPFIEDLEAQPTSTTAKTGEES